MSGGCIFVTVQYPNTYLPNDISQFSGQVCRCTCDGKFLGRADQTEPSSGSFYFCKAATNPQSIQCKCGVATYIQGPRLPLDYGRFSLSFLLALRLNTLFRSLPQPSGVFAGFLTPPPYALFSCMHGLMSVHASTQQCDK